MTPEEWQRVRPILESALELDAAKRPGFLEDHCADRSLRHEIESLIAAHEQADTSVLEAAPVPSFSLAASEVRFTLAKGTRLGNFEILSLLGSGGMGEVYRARDYGLNRVVAIKVLPRFVSFDPDRLRRFEQEAKATAALNHPNILAVFQLGSYEGAPYLVSELLEGTTLREQLVRGPVSLRRAIDYGAQIARGLAAAHEKAIVHRDLKPENLFVTRDGRVKILDFGLAKLTQCQPIVGSSAPTLTEGTEPGMVMGTVGYMAPEQVRGRKADHRADIFAFGAILYEMLSGKRAFRKATSAETMSAILNEDPQPISQIVPNLPPALQRVVQRCLEKNPEQRFQSASDLAFALEALSDSGGFSILGVTATSQRPVYWWATAAVVLAICALGARFYFTRSPKVTITPNLTRLTWDSGLTTDPALSPDGKLLAYASDRSGEGHLDIYVQQVGGGEPLRLTQGPGGDKHEPAFSPDGTTIAFDSADGGIYLVSALGGTPRKLVAEGHGAQFSLDGKRIAYCTGAAGGVALNIPGEARIYVVDAIGGTSKQLRPDFVGATFPSWTSDGQHLLFFGNTDASKRETVDWWVTPVGPGPAIKTGVMEAMRQAKLTGDSQDPLPYERLVLDPDGNGLILPGRFGDTTNLWRIGFSPTKFTITGLPQRVTSGGTREESPSAVHLVNGTKRVAFISFTEYLAVWSLLVQPNQGKVRGELEQLTHDAAGNFMPSISQDGNKIVFVSTRPGQQEVWTKDLRTGRESALTATRAQKWDPKFSPDGSQVAFGEFGQSQDWNVLVVSSAGGAPEMVCEQCGEVTDWSPDGKRIIGNSLDGRAWVLDVASHQKRDLLMTRRWIATDGFSPDGRWFSFIADGSDGKRVYVAATSEQPVPESAWIPVMDGEAWAWSPDGNLLYVVSWRDGHGCIWARSLNPVTKQPAGEPFAVYHSHGARLSLSNQIERAVSVGGNRLVFSMSERTGNIWMAEWKEQ
jgi:Tol biopolymer transport system component